MFVFLRIWPEKIRQLKVSYIWFDKWLVVWLVGSQSFSYERCLCAVTSCYVRIVQMSQEITDQPMWTSHCSCVAEINCDIRAVKWATHVSLTLANARQLYAKTLESLNERIHHPFALTLTTFNPNSVKCCKSQYYTPLCYQQLLAKRLFVYLFSLFIFDMSYRIFTALIQDVCDVLVPSQWFDSRLCRMRIWPWDDRQHFAICKHNSNEWWFDAFSRVSITTRYSKIWSRVFFHLACDIAIWDTIFSTKVTFFGHTVSFFLSRFWCWATF